MVSSAKTQEGNKKSECLCQNVAHANLMYITRGHEESQADRQDYDHALVVICACTDAIQDDPINAITYREWELAFVFLGSAKNLARVSFRPCR